jgi:hypothetical protein
MSDPATQIASAAAVEAVSQVGGLIHRLIGPAADEVAGYLLTGIRQWRLGNIQAVAEKTQRKLAKVDPSWKTPPRVAVTIFEYASWADSDELREAWSNLLIASVSEDGTSEEGLMYAHALSRLTTIQAKIIDLSLRWQIRDVDDKVRLKGGAYTTVEWLKETGATTSEELGLAMESLVSMGMMRDNDNLWYEMRTEERMASGTHFTTHFYAWISGHGGPLKTFYRW